jgi:hypothetical protein
MSQFAVEEIFQRVELYGRGVRHHQKGFGSRVAID